VRQRITILPNFSHALPATTTYRLSEPQSCVSPKEVPGKRRNTCGKDRDPGFAKGNRSSRPMTHSQSEFVANVFIAESELLLGPELSDYEMI
jgi:hypothetical protein